MSHLKLICVTFNKRISIAIFAMILRQEKKIDDFNRNEEKKAKYSKVMENGKFIN